MKLLNEKGEFLNGEEGVKILEIVEVEVFDFFDVDNLGEIIINDVYMDIYIDEVLNLFLVDVEVVKVVKFKVVVDGVNFLGGIIIFRLLELMGVEVVKLYCELNGYFFYNLELLKEYLIDIFELVVKEKVYLGVVVDLDVDCLVFISEDGEMFGEEYILVVCVDYVLSKISGNIVLNMLFLCVLCDVIVGYKGNYEVSVVGEVNVVELMKKNNVIIGGEGNGGIIYFELYYGWDSLVGVVLFLMYLVNKKMLVFVLCVLYFEYYMSKNKIELML